MKNLLWSSTVLLCTTAQSVFAAGGHGDEGHAKTGGLPQLDPSTYTSQVFWLVIVFTFLYLFFSKKSLPEISKVVENRSERIRSDLDTAESLRSEVSAVQKAYEANIAQARQEASTTLNNTQVELKAKADAQAKKMQENAQSSIQNLEQSIAVARDNAMAEMQAIVSNVAIEATHKIIGVRPDASEAKAVIESLQVTSKKQVKAA